MTPINLSNCTRRLAAPKGWDHEKQGICHTLEIADIGGYMFSAWVPSPAELQRLQEGQPIFLAIQGTIHPVVSLTVGGEESS